MAGLAALALSYVLSQFFRTFLAVLTPALTSELGMTKVQLSVASGLWFVTFALMQFVIGIALDRFGPRRTASIGLAAGAAGGALLFALSWSPVSIAVAMAMLGAGCAPILVSSLFIVAHTLSPARFAVFASWLVAFGNLGNLVGTTPIAAAAEAFGWRGAMGLVACLTFGVAILVFTLVKDPPRREQTGAAAGPFAFVRILRLKVLWPILPMLAVNYIPTAGIRGLWAGPYLADVYGASPIVIGNVTFFMAVAMIVGGFAYGPLDTVFGTRKWVIFTGNAVCAALLAVLAILPVLPLSGVTVLFLGIGLFGMSYGMMMAHARAFVPSDMMGRGVTLLNFFSIIGAGLMQFAAGPFVDTLVDPENPAPAYGALFGFYALLLVGALAIYAFSRDVSPNAR